MAATLSHALEVDGFEPDKVVVYKSIDGKDLNLHIFNPKNHSDSDQRPAIVFFFGGGWKAGSPSQFYPHCDYLASRGMVVMAAEYRVESRDGTTPQECVKDGKSAMRWVRANAAGLGIDPERILAGGGSAGGHVAAATALIDDFNEDGEDLSISPRPVALVLFNPVYDNGPDGYGYDRVKDYWESISPMHHIDAETPPAIVFFGTKDKLVPVETAINFKRLMEGFGVRSDLHLYEGQGHAFFNFRDLANFVKTVHEMDRFLVSLGYLPEETTLFAEEAK
ncbi:MAG: alpha/beta hydrolase [Puniceicoccaceae bacterium]